MRIILILMFSSCFFITPAFAGTGHDHDQDHGHSHGPIDKQSAADKATLKVKQLVSAGKIDKSWGLSKVASTEQKTLKNGPEWLVIFNNAEISDKSKQKLYLFYSIDGQYLAANYTGK